MTFSFCPEFIELFDTPFSNTSVFWGAFTITAKIEVTDKNVIWKDFGYEINYSEPDLTDYKEVGPFKFDKIQYSELLEGLKTLTTK